MESSINKLFLGIGCKRGTSYSNIKKSVNKVLEKSNLLFADISCIATCDIKNDEVGLLEYGKVETLKIFFFTANELKNINIPNPSQFVKETTGSSSVSEAAALRASNKKQLIVPKQKLNGITIAIAL